MSAAEAQGFATDDGPVHQDVALDRVTVVEMLQYLRNRWLLLAIGPLVAGCLALGVSLLLPPTFTATTTFLPPQQAQSSAASALGSLGPLAQLAGGSLNIKNTSDQMIALMRSVTISDRMVQQFKLKEIYDVALGVDARKKLAANVRLNVGKKDGIVSIEVDDRDAARSAAMANQYIEELRLITSNLAVTEAQQRRVFFEQLLKESQQRLVASQQALQASGFNAGALKVEPKAAAEAYARLRAEVTAAEVRLQTLRGSLADSTPEVQQQSNLLNALREQLARSEQPANRAGGSDYVGRYREFKYEETLFDLYARQFELARVDESREGGFIQVVDVATPPEKQSWPKPLLTAAAAAVAAAIMLALYVVVSQASIRRAANLRRQQ